MRKKKVRAAAWKISVQPHVNTKAVFTFGMGAKVTLPNGAKGKIVGQFIDRDFITQALVQYNSKIGTVIEEYFRETELK